MRPDEHKKKKNEQYKKKHGIKTDKNEAGSLSKAQDKKKHHDGRRGGNPVQVNSEPFSQSEHRTQSKESSDSESDTNRGTNIALKFEKKTFNRRKIVSNWDKYDLPEAGADVADQSRGEDYSRLASMAGAAMAQFRFKDEQDWEADEATSDLSHILTLDCQSLGAAADCIPLYRRLGVEKDSFTESQVILQELEAQKRLELYQKSCGRVDNDDGGSSVGAELPAMDKVKVQKMTSSGEVTLTNLAKPSGSLLNFRVPSVDATIANNAASGPTVKETSRSNVDIDEDLDFLLSLDSPAQMTKKKEDCCREMLPGEKDNPPTQHDPAKLEHKEENNTINSKSGASAAKEDLEDWLDSVLGD